MENGQVAGRTRKGEARRQSAKPPGSRSKGADKPVRLQIYLSEPTAKRLGVHCALASKDRSAVVEKLLAAWLKANGHGRELWGKADGQGDLTEEGIGGLEGV